MAECSGTPPARSTETGPFPGPEERTEDGRGRTTRGGSERRAWLRWSGAGFASIWHDFERFSTMDWGLGGKNFDANCAN